MYSFHVFIKRFFIIKVILNQLFLIPLIMKICLDLITKIIFTYSCILRKRKHCQDYKLFLNRQYEDDLLNISENADIISENDLRKNQIIEEPLDLRINDLELKRSKSDFKGIDFMNESKKDNNLNKMTIEKDNVTNELIDAKMNEANINAEQQNQKRKEYLSFSHIDNLYSIIEQFVTKIMKKTYSGYYLIRISKIYQTYKILTDNKKEIINYQYIFKTYDPKILYILHCICSQFKEVEFFSEIDCDKFLERLSDMMNSDKDLRPLLNQLDMMHFKYRIYFFYAEFMKCSKYFGDIPELMTLGGIFSDNSNCNLILSIHLINLLLDTTKNIAEIKVFIFFLIKQSFANSFKSRFKFSSLHILHVECLKNNDLLHHNNLNFFLWEMNKNRRGPFLVKLNGKQTLSLSEVDNVHFKTVLLIFIYQQMLFLKLNNVVLEESTKYIKLIHIITTEENCPVCDLNNFLELLKMH